MTGDRKIDQPTELDLKTNIWILFLSIIICSLWVVFINWVF